LLLLKYNAENNTAIPNDWIYGVAEHSYHYLPIIVENPDYRKRTLRFLKEAMLEKRIALNPHPQSLKHGTMAMPKIVRVSMMVSRESTNGTHLGPIGLWQQIYGRA